MTLQTRLSKVITDLEEIYFDCRYTDEKKELDELIKMANKIYLTSNLEH